jgi:urease accessory protein
VGWKAQLSLHYSHAHGHTSAHDRHEGPLRVLQRLYPEGPAICHHVVLHPPGGVVGGDELHLHATLDADAHALITTPGATRFYRTEEHPALQSVRLQLAPGARLEWLPLEAIAHSGCLAESRVVAQLAPGAEMLAWDVLALGLPSASQPFDAGSFTQHFELQGAWLERGRLDAQDHTLLQSPLGLAGHTTCATLWWAAGEPLSAARRTRLLDLAREVVAAHPLAALAGVTAPQPGVVVLRALARRVEPVMSLLNQVRAVWRKEVWGLDATPPRIWQT